MDSTEETPQTKSVFLQGEERGKEGVKCDGPRPSRDSGVYDSEDGNH